MRIPFLTPRSHDRSLAVRSAVIAGLAFAALTVVTGCSVRSSAATDAPGQANGAASSTAAVPAATVSISGSLQSGRLVPDAALKASVSGGTLTQVSVSDKRGASVAGTTSASTGTWTPTHPLALDATYSATATATNSAGRATTTTKKFTTINPSSTVSIVGTTPSSGSRVGNAQPMVVRFSQPVVNKAAVLKQLVLTDTDHVVGAWRWISDTRVDYRPKTYWPMGDKVSLTANLDGVQAGKGLWGSGTTTSSFTVNSNVRAVVDAAAHTMTVYQGPRVLRTIPAGTGMPGFETWGGSMVVLEKEYSLKMTSCSVGLGCDKSSPTYYSLMVYDDIRLTPSGTFIHAAPWDGSIGYSNNSHGCIHLTSSDAAWLINQIEAGDLVTVTNTGKPVALTNGEGDWNLTWAQWTA